MLKELPAQADADDYHSQSRACHLWWKNTSPLKVVALKGPFYGIDGQGLLHSKLAKKERWIDLFIESEKTPAVASGAEFKDKEGRVIRPEMKRNAEGKMEWTAAAAVKVTVAAFGVRYP